MKYNSSLFSDSWVTIILKAQFPGTILLHQSQHKPNTYGNEKLHIHFFTGNYQRGGI